MSDRSGHVSDANAAAADALFEQGMEHCAPGKPIAEALKGIAFLGQASAAGSAKASETLAIFQCLGGLKPIDWRGALDYLAAAAEQGSPSALAQLALMTGARPEQLQGECRAAARSVALDRLLGARPVQLLSASPRIGIVEGFASPEECRWLIEAAKPKLAPSTVFDYATGELRIDPQRTNRNAMLNPLDDGIMVEVIRSRLSRTIGLPLAHFEMSQVLHYAVGQEFKPHHDYFDPTVDAYHSEMAKRGQRVATQLIYLNEDYEGGETIFPSLNIGYQGRTGDALMFFSINERGKPEPLTLHSGLPPTSGEKWTFSQWIREKRPQQPA